MTLQDALDKIGLKEEDIVDYREAKFYQSNDMDGCTYKGHIILTKQKLFFVSNKGFLKKYRKLFEVEVSKITKVSKLPLTKRYVILANTAKDGAGFFSKMLHHKNAQIGFDGGDSFIGKIKELNPKIK